MNRPVRHGGNIIETARRLGCSTGELVDMSSNLTPLDVVPGLLEHLGARIGECLYLPEKGSETLVGLFARRYGLASEQILAGNGTTEFIFALPGAVTADRAVIVNPTYADYNLACERAGIPVVLHQLRAEEDFVLDTGRLGDGLAGGELVFICNPNNPTGVVTPSRNIYELALRRRNSVFLVDESYLPFVREESLLYSALPDNLYVVCSFSKIFGMAGLRLGFIAASAGSMRLLAERTKPWGVNRLAQIAGEYVLERADGYVKAVADFVEQERPRVVDALAALPGVRVVPGAANFILSRLTGARRADVLAEKMLARRFMIRNCADFAGLDAHYFRISLKNRELNRLALLALREIMTETAA